MKTTHQPVIVVNDIAACNGGSLTVLKDFYNAVNNYNDDAQWVFLLSDNYVESTDKVKVVVLPNVKKHFNRIVFDFIKGGRIINKFNPSVVFSLQNTIVRHCNGGKVTYIHQPLPFQDVKKYSFFKKDEFELAKIQYLLGIIIKKSIKCSDLNIVQTKWMKEAVEKKCHVDNVKQIYPIIPRMDLKANYDMTNCFFYPTSEVLYKNNELLVKTTKRLLNEGINLKTTLTIEGVDEDIEYIGRVTSEEVFNYYTNSCLVFPSFIETFGYPLVEASAVGAIILAADCPFSHELLDDYENAYFFDPFESDELYELMKNVVCGKIKRKESKSIIAYDKKNNSWNKVIDDIISLTRS